MGEMREKVSVQGGKEALDWGPWDNSPFSSPATLSTFIKPEAWTAGPSSVDILWNHNASLEPQFNAGARLLWRGFESLGPWKHVSVSPWQVLGKALPFMFPGALYPNLQIPLEIWSQENVSLSLTLPLFRIGCHLWYPLVCLSYYSLSQEAPRYMPWLAKVASLLWRGSLNPF